ncbi:type II toxin-antitoxin system VapC family toxin [Georgenia sp. Z1344]|uniref:type II toxin-antitoxin system VapC family toxin n=1 Tax=Georgenia sp. Z1344 TaxID=3416706 RepID=UPI003CFA8A35
MGVNHLLDTHVLLWLLAAPHRVPEHVRDALADRGSGLVVSAVSAMEVSTKHRLGRLTEAEGLLAGWSPRVAEIGATELPLETDAALLAGRLDWAHRDPFDRLLVAQAMTENLVLVSVDRAVTGFPGLRTLTW